MPKQKQYANGYNITGRLHTDLLEERYGPISVQVLNDDDQTREVLLTDEQDIARTYALTVKHTEWMRNEEICEVNEAILAGEAVGKAFKSRGFAICKNIIDVYVEDIPEWLQHAFAHDSITAKARVSEFLVKKNQIVFNYGLITEIYSPDFRNATITAQDVAQINLPADVLANMGFTKQQIWKYIEQKAEQQQGAKAFIRTIKDKVVKALAEPNLLLAVC